MNEQQAQQLINEIAKTQPVSTLDQSAWNMVLAPLDPSQAAIAIAKLKTQKPRISPADLNTSPDKGPETAWQHVLHHLSRNQTLPADTPERITSAAHAARDALRTKSAKEAYWDFKNAYEANAGLSVQTPQLETGETQPTLQPPPTTNHTPTQALKNARKALKQKTTHSDQTKEPTT